MRIYVQDAPVKGAKDVFAIGGLSDLAALAKDVPKNCGQSSKERCRATNAWTGNKSYAESVNQILNGDLSGVAASDALMSRFEDMVPATKSWRNCSDVVGGVPNVPAFLAGHPLNMRRRERVVSEQAPLCVFASLELSGGINIETMRKRGAAILAFVRLLSSTRPVELWACCSVGDTGKGAHILVRIDTAPLDLARAAHVLTCPSVTRGVGYASCSWLLKKELGHDWMGNWAYGNVDKYRETCRESFARAVCPSAEALLLAAAHYNDPAVNNTEQWLRDMLQQYGGLNVEE